MDKTTASPRNPTNLQQNLALLLKLENNPEQPPGVRVLANFCRHLALSVAAIGQISERGLARAEANEKKVQALTTEVQGFLSEFTSLLSGEAPQAQADQPSAETETTETGIEPASIVAGSEPVAKPSANSNQPSTASGRKGPKQ